MKAEKLLTELQARKRPGDDPHSSIWFSARVRAPQFACPICGSHFGTVEEMLACFRRPVERGRFKVGDIVLVGTWSYRPEWAGSPWVCFTIPARPHPKNHFDRIDNTYLWHVVTALGQKDHEETASLISLPHEGELSYGWNPTFEQSHYAMFTEAEVLARQFIRPDGNDYYCHELKGIDIKPPSPTLRREAKLLAEAGLVTINLI